MKLHEFFTKHNVENGFSFNVSTRETPVSGYAVSCFNNLERTFTDFPSCWDIAEYILDNYSTLHNLESANLPDYVQSNNVVLGGWMDAQTGIYYLDCSLIVSDYSTAMEIAKQCNQIAIFNLDTMEEIRL